MGGGWVGGLFLREDAVDGYRDIGMYVPSIIMT